MDCVAFCIMIGYYDHTWSQNNHCNNNNMDSTGTKIIYVKRSKSFATTVGFEPTRAKPNGLAIHRLNHTATLSCMHIGRSIKYIIFNLIYENANTNEDTAKF